MESPSDRPGQVMSSLSNGFKVLKTVGMMDFCWWEEIPEKVRVGVNVEQT